MKRQLRGRKENPYIDTELPHIDATTYQQQIGTLAETLAQKVVRQGFQQIAAPKYTYGDVYILLRHGRYLYEFLYYLHAEKRLAEDPYWKREYTYVAAPLIRNLLDDLYNLVLILHDPFTNGRLFRLTGYKRALIRLARELDDYGSDPAWTSYLTEKKASISLQIRRDEMNELEVKNLARRSEWKTLSSFISAQPVGPYEEHVAFLRRFLSGPWSEYSASVHSTFESFSEIGPYLNRDAHSIDDRLKIDAMYPRLVFYHLGRAALVLLSVCTEIECAFKFREANIGARLWDSWDALLQIPEARELYEGRYKSLMDRSRIRR